MKRYIGTKLVNAKPMTRLEYNDFRNWELPDDENGGDEGMLIEYIDGGKPNTRDFNGYVSWSPKEVFEKSYKESDLLSLNHEKSLGNTDQNSCKSNVLDVVIFGDDLFKLLSKASSEKEGWMKSSKAMFTGTGCVVQVTTQQKNIDLTYSIAEAVTFVAGVQIAETRDDNGVVISRVLEEM